MDRGLPARPSTAPNVLPRRSVTLPTRPSITDLRERRVSSSGPPDPQVETLYFHSSARIVAFTTNGSSTVQTEEQGNLPWTSKLERTIAIGQMRIYRPPGSVAFLTCGSVIKPILPKSQCWCVDEEGTKFVLLIRRPQYWRIELSSKDLDLGGGSGIFKDVLSTILYFEKTVCPFARGFTIELPEPPKGPIIKKPWRPVEKPKPEIVSVVEILSSVEVDSQDEYQTALSESKSVFGGNESDATDDTHATTRYSNRSQESVRDKKEDLSDDRSKTPPPQLSLVTSTLSSEPPSRTRSQKSNLSVSSSTESFYSTQSWHSPLTPFPPSPAQLHSPSAAYSETLTIPKRRRDSEKKEVISESRPQTPGTWGSPIQTESSPIPQTPKLVYPSDDDTNSVSTTSEVFTPPRAPRSKSPKNICSEPKIRHRATTSSNSRRRTLSPLPSAASMFSPSHKKQKQLQIQSPIKLQVRKLPGAVIRKTYEILLSPPSHLINLMMGIAAKISRGEWRDGWMVWGEGNGGVEMEGEIEEDDYGFEIRRTLTSLNLKSDVSESGSERERRGSFGRVEIPGSWEVD